MKIQMELPVIVTRLLEAMPIVDRQTLEPICLAVQDLSIDSYSSFIWTVRLGGYDSDVMRLVKEGKAEEAFYHHAHVCSDKCLNVHPLLTAIRSENTLHIRCLFYSSYKVLLRFCHDHKLEHLVKLLYNLNSKFPEFRQASPELERYWQEVEPLATKVKQSVEKQVEPFSTTIERYYETGSDKDRWAVIEFLGARPLKDRVQDIVMEADKYENSPRNFERLLKALSRAQTDEIVAFTDNTRILSSLLPYMTQAQKNSKLWQPFECSIGILTNHVEGYLGLGGDIYAPDSKGNPWIHCLMAGCHWGRFKNPEFLRKANCLALNVRQPLGNMAVYYSLAKPYDKWRIETHKYRCARFRNLTKTVLLCIRRIIGRPLPKPCIPLIVERLVQHEVAEANFTSIEPDEVYRICKLKFAAYYLYGFDEGVNKLALSRGIPLAGTNKYLVAELLAVQTCRELLTQNPGFDLSQSLHSISALAVKFSKKYTLHGLHMILTDMKVYPYNHGNRDCDPIPLYELLAFHQLFGFKEAKEPLVKKLKVSP
jgi:hypothetical protein